MLVYVCVYKNADTQRERTFLNNSPRLREWDGNRDWGEKE